MEHAREASDRPFVRQTTKLRVNPTSVDKASVSAATNGRQHVFDAGADGVAPIKLLFEVVETAKGYRPRILVR